MDEINSLRLTPTPISGLSEQIALAIEEAILLGKLKSGERIVEAEVAARMGTSNGPVREALHELEDIGLVVSVPRRGTFVTQFTTQLAREVFSLRAHLEVAALRLAVPALDDGTMRRFDGMLDELGSYPGGPAESERWSVDCDLRFHDIAFDLSDHLLLQQAWHRLRVQARVLLVVNRALWNFDANSPEERAESMRKVHVPLVEALRDRDVTLAEKLFIDHLAEGERRIVRRLASDEAEDETLTQKMVERASKLGSRFGITTEDGHCAMPSTGDGALSTNHE